MHPTSNLRIIRESNLTTALIPIHRILLLCLKIVQFEVVDSRLCDCSFEYQVK